jgi:signal transduction histidine kinase
MPFSQLTSSHQAYTPRHVITAGVLFAISCIVISTLLAINTPWLGLTFTPHVDGLEITHVHSSGPAYGKLQAGDVLASISGPSGKHFHLQALDIMEDPYDLQLYSEFNRFFARQTAIHQLLSQPTSTYTLAHGRSVSLQADAQRPFSSLPFLFWFQLGCGFVSLLIGVGVYAFRQDEIATRCFALSSIGLMAIITAAAMYSTRELAIDGDLFYQLTLLNQYGTVIFVGLGTAVLWYSPRRISPLPMASILLGLYSLFAALHTLQVWETLNVGIRFPIFLFVLFIIGFAFFAWRTTKSRPASRAALKWLLYTWFTGIVLFLSLRLVPVALGFGSLIPQASAWLVLVFIYVGVALGITRYRLFNLDRWVLRAWFWIFSGLAVIGVDIGLVSLLDINTPLATAIALAVIGWAYFPLRQIIWARYAPGPRRIDFENMFPKILEISLSPGQDRELFYKWRDILQQFYKPLETKMLSDTDTDAIKHAHIIDNGISLRLPPLPGGVAIQLTGAEHADRLFNTNDVRFANAVWGLFTQAAQFRLALEQGANEERQRIARDLHDDVAARLLTLVHRTDDVGYEKLARQALGALRDTIYTLGTQTPPPLENLLVDMHHDIQQRLEILDIQLEWEVNGNFDGISLNPRQHINLQRVIQELVSNIIHHAQANKLSINITIGAGRIHTKVCDNGIGGNVDEWTAGKGLHNIQNRIKELSGTVNWQQTQPQGCCVDLQFPL